MIFMVAKTFQSMTQIGEPYTINGKEYVQVRNEKTGTVRQVRWYTENEYQKLYPGEKEKPSPSPSSLKTLLGFHKGYITIFKGDIEDNEDWFRLSNARYCTRWGWYVVSNEEIAENLPSQVQPVKLPWDIVGNPDGTLKSDSIIADAVGGLLNGTHPSQFIGNIGDRLELTITVTKNIPLENQYGKSNFHIMEDADQNVFVWTTASKDWPVGSNKTIRGTVKEHTTYQGIKQTILTRCTERN